MNKRQKCHLDHIRGEMYHQVSNKYRKGAEEHNDNLLKMSPLALLKEIRDEALDSYIYAQTAIDQLIKEGHK